MKQKMIEALRGVKGKLKQKFYPGKKKHQAHLHSKMKMVVESSFSVWFNNLKKPVKILLCGSVTYCILTPLYIRKENWVLAKI